MKRYMFSNGGYGEEYHLMANNTEDALNYLKAYIIEEDIKDFKHEMEIWGETKAYVFPNKIVYAKGTPNETIVKEYPATEEESLEMYGYHLGMYNEIVINLKGCLHIFEEGEITKTETC